MPAATAARKPPAASTCCSTSQARSASCSVNRSTYHDPPAASITVDGVRLQRQHRLRVAGESATELAGARARGVVGEHGDGVGTAHRRGEAGDRRPHDVDGGVVARRHGTGGRRRAAGRDRRRPARRRRRRRVRAGASRRGSWRSWRTGRRWLRVAARAARTRSRRRCPLSARARSVATADGDRVAELLCVGGTAIVEAGAVDRRRRGRWGARRRAVAPRWRGRRKVGVEASPSRSASQLPNGSAPNDPATRSGSAPRAAHNRASPVAAASQRLPASSTTGATSRSTPSSNSPSDPSSAIVVDCRGAATPRWPRVPTRRRRHRGPATRRRPGGCPIRHGCRRWCGRGRTGRSPGRPTSVISSAAV